MSYVPGGGGGRGAAAPGPPPPPPPTYRTHCWARWVLPLLSNQMRRSGSPGLAILRVGCTPALVLCRPNFLTFGFFFFSQAGGNSSTRPGSLSSNTRYPFACV
jgi:hypothetical protein